MTHFCRFKSLTTALTAGLWLWCGGAAQCQVEYIHRTLKDEAINEIALWDLGNDQQYEIFLSTVSGKVLCYSALELDLLWKRELDGGALTAPVIGDFLGNGAPVLAVAGRGGAVTFLWPGTGEIIATLPLAEQFSLAPSVADRTAANRQELVLISDASEIFVVGFDSASAEPRVRLVIPNTVDDATAFSVMGRITHPAAVADINSDGTPEVVTVSDRGIIQVVSLADVPQRSFQHLPQNSRATTVAGVAPLTKEDGAQAQIIIGSGTNLQAFDWVPGQERLSARLSAMAYGDSRGQVLIADVGAELPRAIITATEKIAAIRYVGQGVSGGEVLLDFAGGHITTLAGPLTAPVIARTTDGSINIVAVDGNNDVFVWQADGAQAGPRAVGKSTVSAASFTPAGNLRNDGKLSLVSWSPSDFRLGVHTLPIDIAPDSPPVLTLGVNYSRNGAWTPDWARDYAAAQERATLLLAQMKAQYGEAATTSAPNAQTALTPANVIPGIAPNDEMGRALAGRGGAFTWGRVVLGLVLGAIIGILANLILKRRQ